MVEQVEAEQFLEKILVQFSPFKAKKKEFVLARVAFLHSSSPPEETFFSQVRRLEIWAHKVALFGLAVFSLRFNGVRGATFFILFSFPLSPLPVIDLLNLFLVISSLPVLFFRSLWFLVVAHSSSQPCLCPLRDKNYTNIASSYKTGFDKLT